MDDIDYDRLEYTQPDRISGFAPNLAIITWFKTHAQAIDGWVKFTMFITESSCSCDWNSEKRPPITDEHSFSCF